MLSPLAKVDCLKAFWASIDDGSLFTTDQPTCRERRRQAGEALHDLLLHHRPFLEETTGLDWPYRELAARTARLEREARQGRTPFTRHQARLVLGLLPFPGQWHWLDNIAAEMADDAEVQDFLLSERVRLREKFLKKKQRRLKLGNFCQILKRPNLPREKGVLRIFSLPYLFAEVGLLRQLSRLYLLYVEPPWGVVARHAWLRAFAQAADPVLFGVAGREDADFLAGQDGIDTTRLCHGDFLEEEALPPLPRAREFDLVVSATFDEMERKRQVFLLDLLALPQLAEVTALFIGRGSPENVGVFRARVAERRLGDRVAVLDNLRRRDVTAQLCRCRVGVLVSQNENGCRCLYEYFRADLPAVVSTAMAGCNFDLIGTDNGLAAADRDLPGAICQVLGHRARFSPRAWFLNHSGSRHSSVRLNGELKELSARLGYRWGEDIVPLGSSGPSRYVAEADARAFAGEFAELLAILQPFLPVPLCL